MFCYDVSKSDRLLIYNTEITHLLFTGQHDIYLVRITVRSRFDIPPI
jgi:hypothetical protein